MTICILYIYPSRFEFHFLANQSAIGAIVWTLAKPQVIPNLCITCFSFESICVATRIFSLSRFFVEEVEETEIKVHRFSPSKCKARNIILERIFIIWHYNEMKREGRVGSADYCGWYRASWNLMRFRRASDTSQASPRDRKDPKKSLLV